MKKLQLVAFCAFALCLFIACQNNDNKAVRDAARQSLPVQKESVATPPPPSSPSAPTQVNTSGVQHYICPNNCEGSGGPGAGTCPVCGTAYTHNQAWHNTQQPAASTPTTTTTTTTPNQPTNITPPTPEPPQNADGVWHYTCSNGCSGGAGSATACASCGNTLVHNTAYHN